MFNCFTSEICTFRHESSTGKKSRQFTQTPKLTVSPTKLINVKNLHKIKHQKRRSPYQSLVMIAVFKLPLENFHVSRTLFYERVNSISHIKQAQLSQRDCAAGWVSFDQKWKTGTDRKYFPDIIGLSSTTVS